MDVDGIEPGVDFVKTLDDQVARCVAFLAVIGPGWTDLKNAEGQRRLDQPNDNVRVEIESALKRDIRVIPVLVDGARMPTAEELPDSLKPLSRRNAVTLSHHRFGTEVDELARALQRALKLHPKSPPSPTLAAKDTPTPSWIDFLFSFEGRISRKAFWLSGLFITAVCLLVMAGLAAALGMDSLDQQKGVSKLRHLYTVATLPFYWPAFALYLKRLHDFGQGKGGLWPVAILSVLSEGLSLLNFETGSQVIAIILTGVFVIVGCVKGTPGPNQYGPDPLADTSRRSAT